MLSGRDDDEEADDLTDLLAALLIGALSPVVGNILEVLEELGAVAENVDSLTSDDLEDLTSTDISNDVPDSLLKASKTASVEGVGDGLDSIGKLEESTLYGLDVDLLDASQKIRPGSVHVSNDDVDVTGAARRITHGGTHTLSNTADQLEHILGAGRSSDLSVVLVDEDAEDLSDVLTSSVEVLFLPLSADVLEEVDELAAMAEDVHDLVLDESLDLTVLDLTHDLDDGISHLLDTASLEGVGDLLNTISKGKETLHDRLDVEVLDTIGDKLESIIEVAGHVGDIPDAGGGITHDNVETNSNTLEEVDDVLLGLNLAVHFELLRRSNHETRSINCTGREDQSNKNKS